MDKKWLKRLATAGSLLPLLIGGMLVPDSNRFEGYGSAAGGLFTLAGLCIVALAILTVRDQPAKATDAAMTRWKDDDGDD